MPATTSRKLRYNIFASIIGNSMEWFDFALFGYLAPLFAQIFLQGSKDQKTLFSLFFLYFIGILARPIGGILFSFFGDTLGRRSVLLLSVSFMTAGALITSLLPTRDLAGIFASVLLLFAVILHNLSAGGENPAVVSFLFESAPKPLRSFAVSWVYFGVFTGTLLGTIDFSALFWQLSGKQFATWGWRIPFITAAFFGVVGFLLRRNLHESTSFNKEKKQHQLEKNPLFATLRDHRSSLQKGFFLSLVDPVLVHSLITFMPSYLQYFIKLSPTQSLNMSMYSLALCIGVTPLSGLLAERIGRVRMLKILTAAIFIVAYPLFSLFQEGIIYKIIIGQGILCVLTALVVGVLPSAVCELFPTSVRCTGYALSHNVAVAIFGGTAPLILSFGIQRTGWLTFPSLYLMFGALIAFLALSRIKKDTAIV